MIAILNKNMNVGEKIYRNSKKQLDRLFKHLNVCVCVCEFVCGPVFVGVLQIVIHD